MRKFTLILIALFLGFSAFSQYYYNLYDEVYQNPKGLNTDNEYPVGGGISAGWTVAPGTTGDITVPRWSNKIKMPFMFNFNGNDYDTIRVATSGVVTFTTEPATIQTFGNVLLPQANVPDKSICILGLTTNWASGSSYARVITKTFGTSPNRQFWVSFNSFGATTTTTSAFMTFSIMFEETTNNIYIVDQRVGNGTGLKLSMGIQIDATTAISVTGSPNVVNLAGVNALPDDNAYYEFIKGTKPSYDVSVLKVNMSKYYAMSQLPVDVKGRLVNLGTETITSMDLNYTVNGGATVTSNLTGLNITSGSKYDFTHPTKFNPSSAGNFTIVAWASNINGNSDEEQSNDEASMLVIIVDQMTQRLPLLEVFTSSTCGPCKNGNINLENVIANHPGKYTVIKYQQDFPGSGDPYATTESVNRRGLYGISSIPRMEIDGGWDKNASSFTEPILLDAYAVPSFLEVTAKHTINWHTVTTDVTINPLTNFTNPNLRLFIVIYEKKTTANVKSNGEVEFLNVMKKMVPSETGISIGNLTKGTEYKTTRSFEFKGNYRLPSDGTTTNRINHNIENSVEEFSDLAVLVFVQDYSTKEVFQSAYSTGSIGAVNPLSDGNGIIAMYPNPVNEYFFVDFNVNNDMNVSLQIFNTMGQRVLVQEDVNLESGNHTMKVNTAGFDKGMYVMQLNMGDQTFTRKFIVE